jgi:uncharacterized protein
MAIDLTIDRRGLFYGGVAAAFGGSLALSRKHARAAPLWPGASLLTAARIDGIDCGTLVSDAGVGSFALPARGHSPVLMPELRAAVLVGRRPGSFAAVIDLEGADTPARFFHPLAHHRFAGHAAVHGQALFTTEMDETTGEGAAVLRDARSFAPRERFAVGIEPHDVLFARGGEVLVVAVGGIARAADVKGPAINAGRIESAICELDPRTGTVLRRHALPGEMRSLSLRHMALAPDGETVAFGMQDQDRSAARPLIGLLHVGHGIELLPLPSEDEGVLRSYIGSVAIDASGRYVAATSPKGGITGLWSLADGRWRGGFELADVCGLASGEDAASFWATSGLGDIVALDAGEEGLAAAARWRAPAAFDNHLLRS